MTATAAENTSSTRPITNRHRVSSHALYQSISILRRHGFEKDLFERHGGNVHGHRVQRSRLVEDPLGPGARQHREHTTLAPHALDARRAERRIWRVALEHQVNAAEVLPKVVERTRHHGAAAVD